MIVLVLLLLFGFFTPLPLPGEEGILVNFGNSEQGSGPQEPAPSRQTSPPVVQEKKEVTPPPVTPPPPTPAASQPEVKEEVMTQDFEETVAIDAAKKKQAEEKKRLQEQENKKRQEELERQRKIEQEAQRQVELERQRQAELERQRLAEEAERQRKAEEERKRKEAEQQKIAEINNRASNAFGAGGAGTSDSESTGQGVTSSGGNQGSPNGSANSNNYMDGGGQGDGISYDLGGRLPINRIEPNHPGEEEGKVVVTIRVDKSGRVISAEAIARGSTISSAHYWKAAEEAARKTRFEEGPSAEAVQRGTIVYNFRLK
ncbi:hypothetical protein NC99_19810 [Sunxiuqinia dokdonensis]|uniref:TonB C-terminal domain-containing protein n=1 Tax=Sunxiuqinia dokdonensis TaxID=1409788 RepID=A0A0L8V9K4_9BACT|nr:hypothetical protein NC99_19810 [Sunxiuqinia dokdonensis]